MGDQAFIGMMPVHDPFGGRQPPTTADALSSGLNQYQGFEQTEAGKIADSKVQDADQELKKWNKDNGRITTQNMGKDCKTCPTNFKEQTIDKLKTVREDSAHGTEYNGSASFVLGVKQSVETEISGNEKSGTYYYIDKNNNWIKVTADHAMEGKKTSAKLSGGGKIDVPGGVVSVDSSLFGKNSANITTPNTGLDR